MRILTKFVTGRARAIAADYVMALAIVAALMALVLVEMVV